MKKRKFIASICIAMLSGCSIYQAAHAPAPVEYKQVTVGASRTETIARLGFPKLSDQKGNHKIDTFEFFDGYNALSKGRIILYLAGDIFTLGLAELIFWPIEANAFDGKQCRGTVTYDANDKVQGYELMGNDGARLWFSPVTVAEQAKVIIITNVFNPSATEKDYSKAYAECRYDSNKATVDTGLSVPPTAKAFIPTNNYDVNMAQIRNNENVAADYERQKRYHEMDLRITASKLHEQCLNAKGFVKTESEDKNDVALVKQHCPGEDNSKSACFIQGFIR